VNIFEERERDILGGVLAKEAEEQREHHSKGSAVAKGAQEKREHNGGRSILYILEYVSERSGTTKSTQ